MAKTSSFCTGISSDLRLIAGILGRRRYGDVCSNPSPLNKAADMLRQYRKEGVEKWEYDVVGLRFRIDRPKGSLPDRLRDFSLNLDVSAVGKCDPDACDQFEHLVVNIEITARNEVSKETNISAWHLDRHIGQYDPNEMHPLYHFQHGGKRMEDVRDSMGNVLLLEPPRLPHPPMEALLSIDFVLANFA